MAIKRTIVRTTTQNNAPRRRRRNRRPGTSITESVTVMPPNPPRLVRQVAGARARAPHPKSRSYRDTLLCPFGTSGIRIGMGTMVPTLLKRGTKRINNIPVNTSTCFVAISGPTIGWSSGNGGHLVTYEDTQPGASIGAATGTANCYQASQFGAISAVLESGRTTAGGLRVRVSTAATSNFSGVVFAGLIYDSYSNIVSKTYNSICDLADMVQLEEKSTGLLMGEVHFRPADTTDFQFYPATVSSAGLASSSIYPYLVVVGRGFTAGSFTASFETVQHYEGVAGVDQMEGEDTPEDSSGSYPDMSIEDVAAVTREVKVTEPYGVSMNWLQTIEEALTFARRRNRGNGYRGRAV